MSSTVVPAKPLVRDQILGRVRSLVFVGEFLGVVFCIPTSWYVLLHFPGKGCQILFSERTKEALLNRIPSIILLYDHLRCQGVAFLGLQDGVLGHQGRRNEPG